MGSRGTDKARRPKAAGEIELQYLFAGDEQPVVPVELADLILAGSESIELVDTYYDTAELQLRRAGCTLRVRVVENDPRPVLTWKGPSERQPTGAKQRREVELPLGGPVGGGPELIEILRRYKLWREMAKAVGLPEDAELREIGKLRNRRSAHTYVRGLHRLELTWDRLQYPTGPGESRLEVEVKSDVARRYLKEVAAELQAVFGSALTKPPRGKVKELCARLYPDLAA
jgi:adenylate cyclase class IV